MKFLIFIISFAFVNVSYAKLKITVSIEPIAYLVEQVGGNKVYVSTLVDRGKNPHTFSPSPSQIKALNNSDIFLHVNAPFESIIVNKIKKNQSIKVIGLAQGIKRREMEEHHHGEEHDHKEEHHNDSELDPHIWLSPRMLKKLASTIEGALVYRDRKNAGYFKSNKAKLIIEINKADKIIKNKLLPFKGKKVFVFHPAFGYFLEEYGLEQIPIETEGKTPSPKHIAHIIHEAKELKIKTIFTQPQFSKKAAQTIAKAIGGEVKSINPLKKDILENQLMMANAIKGAYQK